MYTDWSARYAGMTKAQIDQLDHYARQGWEEHANTLIWEWQQKVKHAPAFGEDAAYWIGRKALLGLGQWGEALRDYERAIRAEEHASYISHVTVKEQWAWGQRKAWLRQQAQSDYELYRAAHFRPATWDGLTLKAVKSVKWTLVKSMVKEQKVKSTLCRIYDGLFQVALLESPGDYNTSMAFETLKIERWQTVCAVANPGDADQMMFWLADGLKAWMELEPKAVWRCTFIAYNGDYRLTLSSDACKAGFRCRVVASLA